MEYEDGLNNCDQEILSIIGDSFLEAAPQELQAITHAFGEGNWATLERLAHTQKGLTATFGATRLEHILREIEQGARAGQVSTDLLTVLNAEFGRFCKALDKKLHAA